MQVSDALRPNLDTGASQAYRDWLGVAASLGCAVHCAAMPFVVGLLPLLGLSFLADPSFHKWMVGVCLALALVAFVPGWRRHRGLPPALIGLCGLLLISVAAFAGPDECCPSACAAPTALVESIPETTTLDGAADCAASCCPTDDTGAETQIAGSMPGIVWTLMTPLGGMFLVAGHLCNRLWSCRCAGAAREQVLA